MGGPQGQSGQVHKLSPPTGVRSVGRPACSKSLYLLRYPAINILQRNSPYMSKVHKNWMQNNPLLGYDLSNGAASQYTSSHKQCWGCTQDAYNSTCLVNKMKLFTALCFLHKKTIFKAVLHLHVYTLHFQLHLCLRIPNHTPDLIEKGLTPTKRNTSPQTFAVSMCSTSFQG